MALPPDYLVIIDLEASGNDAHNVNRSEIVEWPWVVYDMRARAVVDAKQVFIAPQWSPNPNPPPESVPGLHVDAAFAPSLKNAVDKFDDYLYRSFAARGRSFCLLADGQWDLRSLLLLECARKVVPLAPHFRTFFNLRAEFKRCYPAAPLRVDRRTIVDYLDIPAAPNAVGLVSCHVMADVVSRMLADNHAFVHPEVVPEFDWATTYHRVPAVAVPVAAAVPVGGIVRLRGLPWTCTDRDIVHFFRGIPIVPNGIHFVKNPHGKPNGEAFVQLHTVDAVHLAQQRHRHIMGHSKRYIEVFKSDPVDMSNHLGKADARRQLHQQQMMHAQAHKAAAAAADAANAANQVAAAGAGAGQPHRNAPMPHGAPPGAYPSFRSSATSSSRGSVQHKSQTSARRASHSHVQTHTRSNGAPIPQHHIYGARMQGGVPGSATGKTFVLRLHGLPSDVAPDDVARLFDDLSMLGNGVHLVTTADGSECTGDAFVEFTSETWGKKALAMSPIPFGDSSVIVARSSLTELRTTLYGHPQAYLEQHHESSLVPDSYRSGDDARRPRPVSLPGYNEHVVPSLESAAAVVAAVEESRDITASDAEESVLRISGLLRSLSESDVRTMCQGMKLCENGVYLRTLGEDEAVALVAVRGVNSEEGAVAKLEERISEADTTAMERLSVTCVAERGVACGDNTDSRFVLRLSGLPPGCVEGDIEEFFSGLDMADDGIVYKGGTNAWVCLASESQAAFAMQHLCGKPLRGKSVRLTLV